MELPTDIFFLPDPVNSINNVGPGRIRIGDWSNRQRHTWLEAQGQLGAMTIVETFLYAEAATELVLSWQSKHRSGQCRVSFTNEPPSDPAAPWVVQLLAPERNAWLRVLDAGTHGAKTHLSYDMPRALAIARQLTQLPSKPTVRIENWTNGTYVIA